MSSLVWVSSAPNGSSISRISGWAISVRISDTRWRMPPDSDDGIEAAEAVEAGLVDRLVRRGLRRSAAGTPASSSA